MLGYLPAYSIYIDVFLFIACFMEQGEGLIELLDEVGIEGSAHGTVRCDGHNRNPGHGFLRRERTCVYVLECYRRMSVRISETKLVMQSNLKIVILKKSGKDMMQLLLIGQLACYGSLGLVQLGGSHHLHGRSDLQRILH